MIAFTVGAFVQFVTRAIFTFNYEKTYKYFGSLFGGFAITVIIYFILIKGIKGSSFLSSSSIDWIIEHTFAIMGISFVVLTLILQILVSLTRINILKIIVLAGTFALSMAFAGNDLVNFIGVPLAGLASYNAYIASPISDPELLSMDMLRQPVQTPTLYLLLAGFVMVLTLWFSRKARSVIATEVDLSRQDEGNERFHSNYFARYHLCME